MIRGEQGAVKALASARAGTRVVLTWSRRAHKGRNRSARYSAHQWRHPSLPIGVQPASVGMHRAQPAAPATEPGFHITRLPTSPSCRGDRCIRRGYSPWGANPPCRRAPLVDRCRHGETGRPAASRSTGPFARRGRGWWAILVWSDGLRRTRAGIINPPCNPTSGAPRAEVAMKPSDEGPPRRAVPRAQSRRDFPASDRAFSPGRCPVSRPLPRRRERHGSGPGQSDATAMMPPDWV